VIVVIIGVRLLFVVQKLLTLMVLCRLGDVVDNVLREEQCSFRKGIGCIDKIFTLRIRIEN